MWLCEAPVAHLFAGWHRLRDVATLALLAAIGGGVYGGIVLALFGSQLACRVSRPVSAADAMFSRASLALPKRPVDITAAPTLWGQAGLCMRWPNLHVFMQLRTGNSIIFIDTWRPRILLACALATLVASCGEGQKQGGAPPPPAVTVAKPIKRTVTDYDEYVGRFVAVNSVEVRARVSGYLDGVHFKDGQIVKQGDLLFTIDKRPFQNTLDQARANLAQAKSNLAFTEADLARGQQLVRDKTITEQTFDQRAQAFRNAQASVSNNEAAVRQAELDLEFTELRAPVNGRIGDRRVSPGNLVTGGTGGNTTLLATIVSTDPIHFEFTFDEASYPALRAAGEDGQTTSPAAAPACR